MSSKYDYLLKSLHETGKGQMKCFGNSMLPILSNPSICAYERRDIYQIGDIVFCKVKGRYIDAHKITAIGDRGYLISNNHNYDNGWTKMVFAKVVSAVDKNGVMKTF